MDAVGFSSVSCFLQPAVARVGVMRDFLNSIWLTQSLSSSGGRLFVFGALRLTIDVSIPFSGGQQKAGLTAWVFYSTI